MRTRPGWNQASKIVPSNLSRSAEPAGRSCPRTRPKLSRSMPQWPSLPAGRRDASQPWTTATPETQTTRAARRDIVILNSLGCTNFHPRRELWPSRNRSTCSDHCLLLSIGATTSAAPLRQYLRNFGFQHLSTPRRLGEMAPSTPALRRRERKLGVSRPDLCLVANSQAPTHPGAYGDRPAVYSRTQPDTTGIVRERPCGVSASRSPVREAWVTA